MSSLNSSKAIPLGSTSDEEKTSSVLAFSSFRMIGKGAYG